MEEIQSWDVREEGKGCGCICGSGFADKRAEDPPKNGGGGGCGCICGSGFADERKQDPPKK